MVVVPSDYRAGINNTPGFLHGWCGQSIQLQLLIDWNIDKHVLPLSAGLLCSSACSFLLLRLCYNIQSYN